MIGQEVGTPTSECVLMTLSSDKYCVLASIYSSENRLPIPIKMINPKTKQITNKRIEYPILFFLRKGIFLRRDGIMVMTIGKINATSNEITKDALLIKSSRSDAGKGGGEKIKAKINKPTIVITIILNANIERDKTDFISFGVIDGSV